MGGSLTLIAETHVPDAAYDAARPSFPSTNWPV